jgi:lipopolysaccharide biosynthesis glycosyltransferase
LSLRIPDTIEIACAVEGEAYVRHCAAMLHSLFESNPGQPIRVHYLHGPDTRNRGRRRLQRMVDELGGEIAFHSIPDSRVQGLPVKGFTGKATWYRVFLPELVADAARILYVDCDLLVVDSLLPLWQIDLEGNLLGAVTNVLQENDRGRGPWLGLPSDESYFNAGVLLLDLTAMRADQTSARVLEHSLTNADRLREGWRDQDALNEVLHDRRLRLHPRWNCMNSVLLFPWASDMFGEDAVRDARRDPAIRHFEGPLWNKPWHMLSDDAARRLYTTHRRATPWPWFVPAGLTPRNLVRYAQRRSRRRAASSPASA